MIRRRRLHEQPLTGPDFQLRGCLPVEEIQRGIKSGVRKINVDTDNRLAITGAIRKVLQESPDKFDPRDYLKPARAAMKQVCIDRMVAFGQAGNASKMK